MILLFNLKNLDVNRRERARIETGFEFLFALIRAERAGLISFSLMNADSGYFFDSLRARGHAIGSGGYWGDVEAIIRTPHGWEGVSDPRRGGGGAGY